jgi:hypothetical protein
MRMPSPAQRAPREQAVGSECTGYSSAAPPIEGSRKVSTRQARVPAPRKPAPRHQESDSSLGPGATGNYRQRKIVAAVERPAPIKSTLLIYVPSLFHTRDTPIIRGRLLAIVAKAATVMCSVSGWTSTCQRNEYGGNQGGYQGCRNRDRKCGKHRES